MAAGEYVSTTAQKELLHRELDVERKSLRDSPKQELAELVAVYEKRGVCSRHLWCGEPAGDESVVG
jgi:VIT1/CCC1 family predicted Fe2+/Mn2+ transporter